MSAAEPRRALRRAGLFCLLVGLGLPAAGGAFYAACRDDYLAAELRLKDSGERHRQLLARRAQLASYLPRFRRLRERGAIGSLPSDWVASLQAASRHLALPVFRYRLTPAPAAPAAADGGTPMRQALVELMAELPHEALLPRLFQWLEAEGAGLFRMESCTLARVSPDAPSPLRMDCRLRWYALSPGGGDGP